MTNSDHADTEAAILRRGDNSWSTCAKDMWLCAVVSKFLFAAYSRHFFSPLVFIHIDSKLNEDYGGHMPKYAKIHGEIVILLKHDEIWTKFVKKSRQRITACNTWLDSPFFALKQWRNQYWSTKTARDKHVIFQEAFTRVTKMAACKKYFGAYLSADDKKVLQRLKSNKL